MPWLGACFVALMLLVQPASARGLRVVPGSAVAGAAIGVAGQGFKAKGLRVTVGGKRARVLSVRPRRLRMVVPDVKPKVHRLAVLRKGTRATGRLRVLKPFTGAIDVRADSSRAEQTSIGPEGGTVEARGRDGTRYTLTIPAGALVAARSITVAPARFGGLPLSGRAFGVSLEPDGLDLAVPAQLRIDPSQALPGKLLGFNTHDGFGVRAVTGSRAATVVSVSGFSSAGAAGVTEADFVNAVQPIVNSLGQLTEGEIEQVIALIARWNELFPPNFCGTQPVCGQVARRALDSLETRIRERCNDGFAEPSLDVVRDVLRFEAIRATLGAADDLSQECREGVLGNLFNRVRGQVCGSAADPLGREALVADLADLNDRSADLDGDGEITRLELLFFLVGPLQASGLDDRAIEAQDCARGALRALPASGRTLCGTDRTAAERDLLRALDYAQRLDETLQPYVDALDFCRIELAVVPSSVSLAGGATQQFAANPQNVIDLANNSDVTWAAARGTINAEGLYTAPLSSGADTITATSVLNTGRSATALVDVGGCAPRGAFPGTNGKLAFNSTRTGGDEIFVMNADGTNPVRLTNNAVNDEGASWSPDGTKIAFDSARSTEGTSTDVYVMNADGSNVTRLDFTVDPERWPSWSPDGTKLAWSRNGDIVVGSSSGGQATAITSRGPGEMFNEPEFSPDQTKLAVAHNDKVAVMNATGGGLVDLADGAAPSWSPDGQKLVYHGPGGGIRSIGVAGGAFTTLVPDPLAFFPAWSPDGAKIIYGTFATNRLVVIDADGTDPVTLPGGSSGVDLLPAWQSVPC